MKSFPLWLALFLSFPVGSHAFLDLGGVLNGILNAIIILFVGPFLDSTCNSILSTIFDGSPEILCENCDISGVIPTVAGSIACKTDDNGLNFGGVNGVTVIGSVEIKVGGGSIFNPDPSINSANGCLDVDATALINTLSDPLKTDLKNKIAANNNPKVCAEIEGSGTAFTSCSVELQFKDGATTRTGPCTCAICGNPTGTGIDLNCASVDLVDLILGTPNAYPTQNLNLPDFTCIAFS